MHLTSVIHILGLLLVSIGACMLIPVPFAYYFDDGTQYAFLGSAVITIIAGVVAYWRTDFNKDVRAKEGFAIVSLGWLLASIFGMLPFLISGAIPAVTDAFFETMSGFTTTGATILTEIEGKPKAILLWRSICHWLGGMGIIVLSLAILPFLGVGGMQLFKAEVPGPVADKLTPRVAQTAKLLWGVYLLLTVAEFLLLMMVGMGWFNALNHALATLSTGGYSTLNSSVGGFENPAVHYIITFFMFLAGANFALHFRFLTGDFKAHIRNTEFRIYASVALIATLIFTVDVYGLHGSLSRAFKEGIFQVFAIVTSTGFGTADFETWSFGSQYLIFGLMFMGGCAGSTAGGMKIARVYLLFKFFLAEIVRLIHPNAIVPVRMDGESVPRNVVENVLGFFVLYLFILIGGILLMGFMGVDFVTAVTAGVSSLSNIGPGLGTIGPSENYAHLPMLTKWLLALMMLMGRLEIFTVVILFSPSYWRK